jgi:quercetin dioxygenase-like cupin family protein
MDVRRIITGHDAEGNDIVERDDVLTINPTADSYLLELYRVVGPPADPHSGFAPDANEPQGIVGEQGGVAWRLFLVPPGDRHLHRTDTLDLVQVLEGEVVLTLDEGQVRLGANDCLVMRGDVHGWRNDGSTPAVLAAVMVGASGTGGPAADVREAEQPFGVAPRRVVTGTGADGKSRVIADGEPPNRLAGGAMIDLWQTMGPIDSPAQGGDIPPGPFSLMPIGGGISWRQVTLAPAGQGRPSAESGAGGGASAIHFDKGSAQRSDDPHVHRTDTIDFILIRDGEVFLEVPGAEPKHLKAGDTVVQRGTWHAWRNKLDRPCTFTALMISTPPFSD